jgi:hypothetical protein
MSKEKNTKYIGKVRNQQTQYGTMQKIYMDNLSAVNEDGTPNKYFNGALIFVDAETGQQFQVKQLSISVPKNGMNPNLLEKGYVAQVSIDINDDYMVKKFE